MAHPSNSETGIIYVILDISTRLHKIGITLDWQRRKRQLNVGIKTLPVCVVRVNKPGEVERTLHVKFKELRLPQSEWFNLDESHLCEIKQILILARDSYKESLLRKSSPRRPNPYSFVKNQISQDRPDPLQGVEPLQVGDFSSNERSNSIDEESVTSFIYSDLAGIPLEAVILNQNIQKKNIQKKGKSISLIPVKIQ